MIARLHNRIIASLLLSCSLVFQSQAVSAESAHTDILFTGTVPVTCAFAGLSPAEQLNPQIVTANRQINCNEGTVSLSDESGILESTESTYLPKPFEQNSSAMNSRQQQRVITITAQ